MYVNSTDIIVQGNCMWFSAIVCMSHVLFLPFERIPCAIGVRNALNSCIINKFMFQWKLVQMLGHTRAVCQTVYSFESTKI